MMRGDFVTIAMQGDFDKPRPALVIQADPFNGHISTTVLPVTSTIFDAPLLRVTVSPSAENGLNKLSQVMIDKAVTVPSKKLGPAIGRIDADAMMEIDRRLALFLGVAK
ncbi:MAG: type II toxin-antitoxin system PemK/MazF family toxin [Burkholderiaceae bacterium]|jgi:mRNA interferase MazF|nr:type II toxin-antitoxin system PemK/MazF family toxin [Burkholderiaceae bacterium]